MNLRPTRRQVLQAALLAAIGTELWYFKGWFGPYNPLQLAQWRLRSLWLYVTGARPVVAIARCASYQSDVLGALRLAWRDSGRPASEVKGKRVVLKPNLAGFDPGHPVTTAPEVVEAAILLFRELGAAEIVVADGPTFTTDIEGVLARTGLDKVLKRQGVRFVDLDHDDLVEIPLKGGYTSMKSLFAPRTIVDAEYLVSMPKLKTHHWTTVSLSLKNLFGTVPGSRYGWPKNILHWEGIPFSILALYDTFRPQLAIVDGIVGMEADGPLVGRARDSGVLLVGADGVAVDATASRLMGFDPDQVLHLRFAGLWGLGVTDGGRIEVTGERLAGVAQKYEPPPTSGEDRLS
jgi:uncharacterized protein (DUF362 family)